MNRKTSDYDGVFKTVFDNAADGMVLADIESKKIRIANPVFCEMLGFSFEEITKMSVLDIHPERDLDFVLKQFNRQAKGEISLACEIPLRRKDGSIFYTDVNSMPVKLDNKKCLMGIFRDITERRQIETTLKENEEKFRLVMDATNDALWDWNILTNEVYRNPRHATMLGYQPHELTASQDEWTSRIHPDDRQLVMEYVDKCLNYDTDENFKIEYRLRTKSGDYKWILGRGKVVSWSNDGKPLRMIGTNIDITKRKETEEELLFKSTLLEAQSETTIDGILVVDEQGKILLFNKHFEQMWKVPREILEIKDDKTFLA
ncbi:PAS domain S-box protein, partial [Planctomycetota bacterium]